MNKATIEQVREALNDAYLAIGWLHGKYAFDDVGVNAQMKLTAVLSALSSAEGEPTHVESAEKLTSNLVPGKMHCARCNFSLIRKTLYMQSGTVGAGDSVTEPCPNGCGPLWPVTWEQEAREGYEICEAYYKRATEAESQIAELANTSPSSTHSDVPQDSGNGNVKPLWEDLVEIGQEAAAKGAFDQPEAPALTDQQVELYFRKQGWEVLPIDTFAELGEAVRALLAAPVQAAVEPMKCGATRYASIPHPHELGMRIVGVVLPADQVEPKYLPKEALANALGASPDAQAIRDQALEDVAKACMRTTPDKQAVKAIGDAAHYMAAANAIRALKSQAPQPAQDACERDQWKPNDAQACAIRDVAMEEIAAETNITIEPDSELLPCPHCESDDVELCGRAQPNGYTWIQCFWCGARTQEWDRFDKTIGHWNRRAALTQPSAEADESCTEPDRKNCPRLCADFCNKEEVRKADERELPPLPLPEQPSQDRWVPAFGNHTTDPDYYTADQMHAYAQAALAQSPARQGPKIDFNKPLETVDGESVKYICSDVVEYKCARIGIDSATGVSYSSPYIGLRIRNVAASAPHQPASGENA